MSVTVTCTECDAEFEVSAAKAGQRVPCPDCDAENKVPRRRSSERSGRHARPGASEKSGQHSRPRGSERSGRHPRPGESVARRPGAEEGVSTTKVALIGVSVLVFGILAMVTAKFVMTPDIEYPEDSVAAQQPSNGDAAEYTPNDAADADSKTTTVVRESATQLENATQTPVTPVTNTQSTSPSGEVIVDATGSDRARQIMAAMTDAAVHRSQFTQDARGDIGRAVETGVRAALEGCKLTYRAGKAEPVMNIYLDVRQQGGSQKLWMSAELLAKQGGQTIRVWERKGTITTVDDKALKSGVVPRIDRDLSQFFRNLRAEFIEARRQAAGTHRRAIGVVSL